MEVLVLHTNQNLRSSEQLRWMEIYIGRREKVAIAHIMILPMLVGRGQWRTEQTWLLETVPTYLGQRKLIL